jgi:hypothetical protein
VYCAIGSPIELWQLAGNWYYKYSYQWYKL